MYINQRDGNEAKEINGKESICIEVMKRQENLI